MHSSIQRYRILLLLPLLLAILPPACQMASDDELVELDEISREMDQLKIGGGRWRRRGIQRDVELMPDNLRNLPSNLVREGGGGQFNRRRNNRFVQRRGSFSAAPTKRNLDRSGKIVLNKYKKMRDKKRFGYLKNVNKGEWDVYLNTYHMASGWNRVFGKVLPALHSAVEFRGPGWPDGGREFSYDVWRISDRRPGFSSYELKFFKEFSYEVGSGFNDRINEKMPRQFGDYQFHKSKYMGKTKMNPRQVRRYVEHLRETKYKPDSYHITKRNCNHCAKDILKKTIGKRPPPKVNRLARGVGKLGLNRIGWFG